MKTQILLNYEGGHRGANYPRLLRAKRRCDPSNLFTGHHVVGN